MPNFAGLLRAPVFRFEVILERRPTLNAYQNARKIRRQVHAKDEADAKAMAVKGYPEFVAVSAKKVTI